jgi:DNA invertase Pin-like site-specific DNA recombinase
MPPHYGKFIAYFRVSTDRQGKSGLGLAAQREAVMSYLDGGRWALVDEFTEVESGKRNDRPELVKALAACKKQKAKLVIAKLDRLSRNLAFIAALMDSGVEFVAVDNPHANKLTIHILAAVAQHEREIISARTSAALKAAHGRHVEIGAIAILAGRLVAAAARLVRHEDFIPLRVPQPPTMELLKSEGGSRGGAFSGHQRRFAHLHGSIPRNP